MLNKLRRAILNKRRGILTSGVVLIHDNARPHTAACTQALLEHFNWELFDHPPYSPPSDYHLITYLKNWLGSQCVNNNEEMMEGVRTWLSSQAADFSDIGIQNLSPNMSSASIPAVIMLRRSLSIYIFFIYTTFSSHCLLC
jgi:hypothetical protein